MPRWAWSIISDRVGKVRLASSTLGQPTLAAKHRPPGDPQAVVEIYVSEDGGARVKLRDWRADPLHAIDEPRSRLSTLPCVPKHQRCSTRRLLMGDAVQQAALRGLVAGRLLWQVWGPNAFSAIGI